MNSEGDSQTCSEQACIEAAKRTIRLELAAIAELESRIDHNFVSACEAIYKCQGRVVVCGMGKSGHIGKKIAATLASTGTPAFFVHPGEANHGDIGMITKHDVVIAISNSGGSAELISLLPVLKRLDITVIAMTGQLDSALATAADHVLNINVKNEACPLGLAPTSSTTVTLVLGDALAVALLERRGFTAEDFAFAHPGGALGRKLLIKVADLMHQGSGLPIVNSGTTLAEALVEMSLKGFGMTMIVDGDSKLLGIFTDGDLRRVASQNLDFDSSLVDSVMSKKPRTISANQLAAEALHGMEQFKITSLVVLNQDQTPAGLIHLHDILRAGVI